MPIHSIFAMAMRHVLLPLPLPSLSQLASLNVWCQSGASFFVRVFNSLFVPGVVGAVGGIFGYGSDSDDDGAPAAARAANRANPTYYSGHLSSQPP
jgi:hypothetical protein